MKLKAPQGIGDPCVDGVIIVSRDGVYEVEPEIGVLLIESFGFIEVGADDTAKVPPAAPVERPPRAVPPPKLSLPAWRARPAAKKPTAEL